MVPEEHLKTFRYLEMVLRYQITSLWLGFSQQPRPLFRAGDSTQVTGSAQGNFQALPGFTILEH